MQTETTNAPFLPMGQQGEQGYEAHFELSETLESTQFHCHDYYEFYIHLHGGESMGVENRLFPLKPNQVFILLPFSMHGLSCTQTMHNYERGYLNLSPEILRKLSCGQIDLDQFFRSHASGGVCTYQLNDADAAEYVRLLSEIRDNQKSASWESDAFIRFRNYALMIQLLSLLCRTLRHDEPVQGESFGNSIIQEILDYINNHYNQPIRIENLAKSFGVSISYLSHEFARFTHRSVYDYVLYRRVMLARQQMMGSATLNEIAYQCGFNDYSNFLRSFSKIVGMSPSQYRKQLKQYRNLEVEARMAL